MHNNTGERSFCPLINNHTILSFVSSDKFSISFPSDHCIPQFTTFCHKEVSLFFGSDCHFSLDLYLPLSLKQKCQVTLTSHQ